MTNPEGSNIPVEEPRRFGGPANVSKDLSDDPAFTAGNDSSNDPSLLDALTRELQSDARLPDVTYDVKTRNNVSVTYDLNIDGTLLQRWQRACNSDKNGFDAIKFSCMVIANCAKSIQFGGKTAHEEDGSRPITFRSSFLKQTMNTVDVNSTVRKFMGRDSEVMAQSSAVLEAAGYDEQGQRVDEEGDNPLT